MVVPDFRIQPLPDLFKANVGQGAQLAMQGFSQLQRANENEADDLFKIQQQDIEKQKLLGQPGFKMDEKGKIVFDADLFKIQKAAAIESDVNKASAIANAQAAAKQSGADKSELFKINANKQAKVSDFLLKNTGFVVPGSEASQRGVFAAPEGIDTGLAPIEGAPNKFLDTRKKDAAELFKINARKNEGSDKGTYKPTKGGGILNTSTGEMVVPDHGLDESKLSDIDKEELKGIRADIQASQFNPAEQSKAMVRYNSKIAEIRGRAQKKVETTVPEFKTEAEAIKSGKKGRVTIGGRPAVIN